MPIYNKMESQVNDWSTRVTLSQADIKSDKSALMCVEKEHGCMTDIVPDASTKDKVIVRQWLP